MHKPLPTIAHAQRAARFKLATLLPLTALFISLSLALPAAALQSKSANAASTAIATTAAKTPAPTKPLLAAPVGGAKDTLGWLQSIRLLPHKVRMTAKLDTGAKSSVIHALDIKPFKKKARRWVRFTVPVEKKKGTVEMKFELPVFSQSRIKQHHSEELDRRYVVQLDFCIAGKVYTANFSLDDRDKFNYPMLLGRDFLQDYFVVDPSQTFVQKYNCLPQSKG